MEFGPRFGHFHGDLAARSSIGGCKRPVRRARVSNGRSWPPPRRRVHRAGRARTRCRTHRAARRAPRAARLDAPARRLDRPGRRAVGRARRDRPAPAPARGLRRSPGGEPRAGRWPIARDLAGGARAARSRGTRRPAEAAGRRRVLGSSNISWRPLRRSCSCTSPRPWGPWARPTDRSSAGPCTPCSRHRSCWSPCAASTRRRPWRHEGGPWRVVRCWLHS